MDTLRKLSRAAVLMVLIFAGRACVDNRTTQGVTAAADTPEAETAPATSPRDTAFPVLSNPKPLGPLMQRELRGCFDFFWNEWISDPKSPTYGMTSGDYVGMKTYSPIPIESQGFYFAAIVIGVERGWITRKEGYDRILITLKTINELDNSNGFYDHFIDPGTGLRGWNNSSDVELTNAGTGTMILGAMIAGEYFGGEVKQLADELYARMNWRWFTNPKTRHPYLACYPEGKPSKIPRGMNEEGLFGADH